MSDIVMKYTKARLRYSEVGIHAIIDALTDYVERCREGELSGYLLETLRQIVRDVEIKMEVKERR